MKHIQEYFRKTRHFVMAHKVITAVGVVLVLVILGGFLRSTGSTAESVVVEPREFLQQVSVSGTVVAANNVDLSFPESGRVGQIFVDVGDTVVRGQALAQLSLGTLQADLLSARADLALRRAEARNTELSLERIQEQQDTLVESAYQKLLAEGLVASPDSSTVTATAPIITGRYTGEEGVYKIVVNNIASGIANDIEIRTFNIENTGPIKVSLTEPTQLGTKGLFITFPDSLASYEDTTWYVVIPNTKSSSYQSNYADYQEALRTRERAISDAEAELRQQSTETTIAKAQVARAEAAVARVQAQIEERTIRAPFGGTITAIDVELGEIATAQSPVLSLINKSTLEIESFVPEINVPLLAIEDPAVVTLDAYGADTPFAARVVFIDPAETIRDGVSTYRTKLAFEELDERIRSGMTANVVITTDLKPEALMVPLGAVVDRNGAKFLNVLDGGESVLRPVTLGGVSLVGEVEILSGVKSGERVGLPQ